MLYTVCQILDICSTSPTGSFDRPTVDTRCNAPSFDLLLCDKKLRVLGVHPQKYSYALITATHSVYVKLMIPWIHQSSRITLKQSTKWCYIGSTSVGVLSREHNRRAKVKQCQAGHYVQVEPAIRVWAKSMLPCADISTLVVQCFDNYKDAWIQEHVLIDLWQARLNFHLSTSSSRRPLLDHRRLSSRTLRPLLIRLQDYLQRCAEDLVP